MVVMHVFYITVNGRKVEGPVLTTADIAKLRELFPENQIWKAKTSDIGNQYYPTLEEAQDLFNAMVEYYCTHDVDEKMYDTGDTAGGAPIGSSLISVFEDLLPFFEKDVGFKMSDKAAKIIAAKREARAARLKKEHEEWKAGVLKDSEIIPPFKRITPDQRAKIEKEAEEAKDYIARSYQHPSLAMQADRRYRMAAYTEIIVKAVDDIVLPTERLTAAQLLNQGWEKYGEGFDPDSFFAAMAIIAHHADVIYPDGDFGEAQRKLVAQKK